MSLEQQQVLIPQIGQSMMRLAGDGWTTITLRLVAIGNGMEVDATTQVLDGIQRLEIDMETSDELLDLREVMYQPGTGTWFQAVITVTSNRQIEVDFDYDSKPYEAGEEGSEDLRDLLMYDQELFPRDNEHLPDWHPAKQ